MGICPGAVFRDMPRNDELIRGTTHVNADGAMKKKNADDGLKQAIDAVNIKQQ
jgi:hypothetical protein